MTYEPDATFTGERCILGASPMDIEHEHLARYELACSHAAGQVVLDAACGSGYGTAMLADAGAASVLGLDISDDTIRLARHRYREAGISFNTGDVRSLPVATGTVDLYVCFETIEHIAEGSQCIAEAARILRPGGLYIVSTPDRLVTNPGRPQSAKPKNPFHVVEYTPDEMLVMLQGAFTVEAIYGQVFVHVRPKPRDVRGLMRDAVRFYGLLPALRAVRRCVGVVPAPVAPPPPHDRSLTVLGPDCRHPDGRHPTYLLFVARK